MVRVCFAEKWGFRRGEDAAGRVVDVRKGSGFVSSSEMVRENARMIYLAMAGASHDIT